MNFQFNEVYEPVVVAECEHCHKDIIEGGEGVEFEGESYCNKDCFVKDLEDAGVLVGI